MRFWLKKQFIEREYCRRRKRNSTVEKAIYWYEQPKINVERSSACKKKLKQNIKKLVRFSFVLLEINELLSKVFCWCVAHSTLNKCLNDACFYYLHFKSFRMLACAQQRRWSKWFSLSGNYVPWNTLECVCAAESRFLLNDEDADDEGKIVNIETKWIL